MITFLLTLLVAAVLGSLGAAIAGRRGQGCLVNILVGLIGALVGRWLSQVAGIDDPRVDHHRVHPFPLLWTIAGAALFVAVITFLTGERRTPPR